MKKTTLKNAVETIDRCGILLVYPIDNRKAPPSLWSEFHPRTPMRWEWDNDGDDRVADLWHLRAQLSQSGKVVYAKWYQGRATFFSREIFTALLSVLGSSRTDIRAIPDLSREALQIYEVLSQDSPLSTKMIRRTTELVGRALEPAYAKAMKALFNRLLIVGFGEVDDGAFPSLAQGTTRLLFEDLWIESRNIPSRDAWKSLRHRLGEDSLFIKYLLRLNPCPESP